VASPRIGSMPQTTFRHVADGDGAVVDLLDDGAGDVIQLHGHREIAHHDLGGTGVDEAACGGARRLGGGLLQLVKGDAIGLHLVRVRLNLDALHAAAHVEDFSDAGERFADGA
jgi:hypothetical protein